MQVTSESWSFFFRCRGAALALALAPLVVGCGAILAPAIEPLASREIQVPPGTAAPRILACAEKTVLSLHKTRGVWDTRITLKDQAGGRFETGNFSEMNVMGFRVRVGFDARASIAQVQVKGAGPYFTDLGVDSAIETFVQQTTACLASSE